MTAASERPLYSANSAGNSAGCALNSAGFTLIEVLIVTVLLAFLAFSTFVAVRSTIRAKEEIDQRTDLLQESRAVLSIVERDLRLAFFLTPEDFIWQPTTTAPQGGGLPPAPPQKPDIVTIFQGKASEIFFSSNSHQRMSAETPENQQHFVTYQLSQGNLIRAESPRAVTLKDRESPASFREFTLLKNVKSFTLGYWDSRQEKWVDLWDTEKPEYQNLLPEAVKIDIEYTPTLPENSRRNKDQTIKISTAIRLGEPALKRPQPKTP